MRNCLRTLDPVGIVLQWQSTIYGRKYNVPTPNALWAHRQMEVNNSCVLMDIPELLFMPIAAITTELIHYWSNLLEMSTVMDYLLR
mgnify:CR=1 FL=1